MDKLAKLNPTSRFSSVADLYAKFRPSYPDQVITFITSHCQLSSGAMVVDIGCGTGIASRLFAAKGLDVIGIEPNEEMRALAMAESSLSLHPSPSYQNGTAEATGLESTSADVVIACQSFHWFDAAKALKEFHRILKPNGWVALLWNERDESDTFTKEYGEALRTFPDTNKIELPRHSSGEALLTSPLFTCPQKVVFANEQELDQEGLLGRAFSTSYAPKDPPQIEILSCLLHQIYERHQKSDVVKLKYHTTVYLAKRKELTSSFQT